MGNVIKFPACKTTNQLQRVHERTTSVASGDDPPCSVISSEEDEAFLELVREWPSFNDLPKDIKLHELFELYYDDKLTLAQDCALEFMFHMHDPDSTFDIGNALYTWEEEDRNFFILSINMHAELIEKIKKDEI